MGTFVPKLGMSVTYSSSGKGAKSVWRKAEELNPQPYLGAVVPVFEAGCRPHSDAFRSGYLAEGVGVEPTQPCLGADLDVASQWLAARPTFRTTRMIGIDCGAGGVDSNPRPLAYKASALPAELRQRWSFWFVWPSLRNGLYNNERCAAIRGSRTVLQTPKRIDADSRREIGDLGDEAESETRFHSGLQRARKARSSRRRVASPATAHPILRVTTDGG